MSFVERSIILCPYLGGSTIRGSTVWEVLYDKATACESGPKLIGIFNV